MVIYIPTIKEFANERFSTMDKQTFTETLLKEAREIVSKANKERTFNIINGATIDDLEQQLLIAKEHLSKSTEWDFDENTVTDFWGSEEDVKTELALSSYFHEVLGFDISEHTTEQIECDECGGYQSQDCEHCTSNSVLASAFYQNTHAQNSATRYAIIELLIDSLKTKKA